MSLPELPEPELGYIETDKSRQPAFSARQMRAALQAQPAEVERETTARREAQEQLYAARERHTAEVKGLQAEIGRLQALATTERKGEPVVPADLGAWLWSKLADYCRRKGLNPHHENDLFNLAGELRNMLAHTSPQVPEDVQMDAERYRWLRAKENANKDEWNLFGPYSTPSEIDAAIDAARKGE